MKTTLLALALGTALVTSAQAADVYQRGSTKDAPDRDSEISSGPGVNWTGFYIGVQGGYGNANHNLTVQEYQEANEGDSAASFDFLNLDGINSHGGIGGGRVGFDLQRGRLLFGVFAGYDFTNMETTVTIPGLGSASLEKQDEWSVGGRVGLLLGPRTMAYALAAYTQTEYDLNGLGSPTLRDGDRFKTGATFNGISVGGGMEYALSNNVFFGVEYVHTFYDEETIFDAYDANCNNGLRVIDDLDEDKIMATLKIKLNTGIPGMLE